jgi:cytochrome c
MNKMKVMVLAASTAVLSLGAVANATADDALALATKSGCMACHQVEMKVVGPAYKDVAAKYKGQDGALDTLAAKVKAGGSGVWGPVPMPPNVNVSDEDIKTIVTWVLSL